MRAIYCQKLQAELPGLKFPPIPGPLGQQIFECISQLAWQKWIEHQTILINEYKLNLTEPKSRAYLTEEMENLLFPKNNETSLKPKAYTPIKK